MVRIWMGRGRVREQAAIGQGKHVSCSLAGRMVGGVLGRRKQCRLASRCRGPISQREAHPPENLHGRDPAAGSWDAARRATAETPGREVSDRRMNRQIPRLLERAASVHRVASVTCVRTSFSSFPMRGFSSLLSDFIPSLKREIDPPAEVLYGTASTACSS